MILTLILKPIYKIIQDASKLDCLIIDDLATASRRKAYDMSEATVFFSTYKSLNIILMIFIWMLHGYAIWVINTR